LSFFSVVRSSLSILYSKAAIKRENNIKVTSLNSRMRYPQIFINHSGYIKLFAYYLLSDVGKEFFSNKSTNHMKIRKLCA
ncbi:hypothetical protein WN873_02890, partial [Tetragenococcus halophilus]|uniref:hypothetical protein n=1 Tax=Tetragenococcus halophilus TaxID=51669 RepID=UPI0030F1AE60